MNIALTSLAAAATLFAAASAEAAGPVPSGQASSASAQDTTSLLVEAGWNDRRKQGYAGRDCRPYNGPYGYYGNPYCEGGFTRDGEAGGYEIDLTRFFDERYYYDRDRRYRRYR